MTSIRIALSSDEVDEIIRIYVKEQVLRGNFSVGYELKFQWASDRNVAIIVQRKRLEDDEPFDKMAESIRSLATGNE